MDASASAADFVWEMVVNSRALQDQLKVARTYVSALLRQRLKPGNRLSLQLVYHLDAEFTWLKAKLCSPLPKRDENNVKLFTLRSEHIAVAQSRVWVRLNDENAVVYELLVAAGKDIFRKL